MSFFFNVFGGKKASPPVSAPAPAAAPAPVKPARVNNGQSDPSDIMDRISSHNKKIEGLEKRMKHLESKIEQCEATAREKVAKKDQKGALHALNQKKLYTKEVETLQGSMIKLEQQVVAMESASVNTSVITDLKSGNETLRMQRERAGIDEDTVTELFDSLEEELQTSNAISDALAQPAKDSAEDEDLLAELAALNAEGTESAAPAVTQAKSSSTSNAAFQLPVAPLPTVPTRAAKVQQESEEEAELRRIQAEMGM